MPTARSEDMARQLAEKGLMWDGTQIVPIPEAPVDDYEDPVYDPGPSGGYAMPNFGRVEDSPEWAALNAELDRMGGLQSAEAQRQKGIATAERDRLLTELTMRGDVERKGVEGAMETRGLYYSGETQENLARQRQNELSRSTAISTGAATRIGDIEAQLAMQQAELSRKRAEARASFVERGYQ